MIIEFFGFPGSGKTTLSNELIKTIKNENCDVIRGTFDHHNSFSRIGLKVFYCVLSIFYNYRFFFHNFKIFIATSNKANFSPKDFLNVTYLYARYSKFKKSKNIIVFDQGLCQAYLSILTFNDNIEYNFEKILDVLDTVIILDLEYQKNKERLLKRGNNVSRVEKNVEMIEDLYRKYVKIYKSIRFSTIPNQYTIDANRDIFDNVKYITQLIGHKSNINNLK